MVCTGQCPFGVLSLAIGCILTLDFATLKSEMYIRVPKRVHERFQVLETACHSGVHKMLNPGRVNVGFGGGLFGIGWSLEYQVFGVPAPLSVTNFGGLSYRLIEQWPRFCVCSHYIPFLIAVFRAY